MAFVLDEALAVLERSPAILRAWLDGLPEAWVRTNEGPDTWSPYDVVGHLIHGEETDWVPRTLIILREGESRPFEPFDRFAFAEQSEGKSLHQLLDDFEELRRRNLHTIRDLKLTDRHLALHGVHPDFGRVTLRELLATWVAHDLSHLAQIARVMARRYDAAVGPWKRYLGVLSA